MDLTVKEAAKLLDVSDDIVFDWIRDRNLPAYRIKNQFRINRESAFEWATVNGIRISPAFINSTFKNPANMLPTLVESILSGGIYYGLKGETSQDVLASAVYVLPLPETVERKFLLQMLLARETIGSTGIGEGIAIPHPRNPIVLSIDKPLVAVLFPEHPIDFNAVDNQPVVVFFLLISPTVRTHLHLLSRIAFTVQNQLVKKLLHSQESAQELLPALKSAENGISTPGTKL